jgi:hypothetical protein
MVGKKPPLHNFGMPSSMSPALVEMVLGRWPLRSVVWDSEVRTGRHRSGQRPRVLQLLVHQADNFAD